MYFIHRLYVSVIIMQNIYDTKTIQIYRHYKDILNLSFAILQNFILLKFMIEIQIFNGSFK